MVNLWQENTLNEMLEKIHKQPMYVRRNITIVLTVLIFATIIFLWQKASDINIDSIMGQTSTSQSEAESPFSIASDAFSKLKDGALRSIEEVGSTSEKP